MHDVDADGEIDLDAAPPGTGRVLGVWKAERCAKLAFSADSPLTIANMAAWMYKRSHLASRCDGFAGLQPVRRVERLVKRSSQALWYL